VRLSSSTDNHRGDAEGDRISGVEQVDGSNLADNLGGDGAANLLNGLLGMIAWLAAPGPTSSSLRRNCLRKRMPTRSLTTKSLRIRSISTIQFLTVWPQAR
jgi:hypothetical protein